MGAAGIVTERARLDLYLRHRSALVDYATPILGERSRAEDVVQEAYIRLRNSPSVGLLGDPRGYLYRIVRNLALDTRRRLSLEQRYSPPDCEDAALVVPDETPSVEADLIARQELASVLEAFAELPERTRIAMEMHRFGGSKLREIAAHLGISQSLAHKLVVQGTLHCQRRMRR